MDQGTLSSSKFTVFDERIVDDPAAVSRLLTTTFLKVTAARMMREQLRHQLQLVERVYLSAVDSGRASVRQSVATSVTSLLTMTHLLDRYLLLMARDCLRLESCLRGPAPVSYWRAWRSSLDELHQRIPNVHDYFLWQLSSQSQDEADQSDGTELRSSTHVASLRRDAQ